jgi:hypothetical protein
VRSTGQREGARERAGRRKGGNERALASGSSPTGRARLAEREGSGRGGGRDGPAWVERTRKEGLGFFLFFLLFSLLNSNPIKPQIQI